MLDLLITAILAVLAIIIVVKVTGKILKIVLTLALVGGIVYFVASFISSLGADSAFLLTQNLLGFCRFLGC